LPLKNKLTCIRVCHRWQEFISSTNLYEHLKFIGPPDEFYQAFALFDSKKEIERTVKQLEFFACNLDVHSLLYFPNLFPNVKQLI
jgi:hypothetical protein